MAFKIRKLDNGQVKVTNTKDNSSRYFDPQATLDYTQGGKAVGVFYGGRVMVDLYANTIQSLQVGNEPEETFNGNAQDLADKLGELFFFRSVGGEAGADFIDTYFYSVNVANSDSYPFLIHTEEIPEDNAISFEVDYIGFRTDTNAIGKRQTLAKYAANDGGVISVAATAAALTSSNYSITASIVQNGSSLELQIDAAGGFVSYNFWVKIRKINK